MNGKADDDDDDEEEKDKNGIKQKKRYSTQKLNTFTPYNIVSRKSLKRLVKGVNSFYQIASLKKESHQKLSSQEEEEDDDEDEEKSSHFCKSDYL